MNNAMRKQNITDVLYACRHSCIQKKIIFWLFFFSKKFTTDSNEPTSTQILCSNTFLQQQKNHGSLERCLGERMRAGNIQEDHKAAYIAKIKALINKQTNKKIARKTKETMIC